MTSSDLQLSNKYQRDLKKPNTVEFTINFWTHIYIFEHTNKKTLNIHTHNFEPNFEVLVWKSGDNKSHVSNNFIETFTANFSVGIVQNV